MKNIKEFKTFESEISMEEYLKTFAKQEVDELNQIFADLKDEFLTKIDFSIRPYIWDKTTGLSYEIRIDYSLLKYRTAGQDNPEGIIDSLCDSSDNLSKFWTILNECLRRIRNGNFKYGTSVTGDYVSIQLVFN